MPFQERGVGLGAAGSAAPGRPSDWPKAHATLPLSGWKSAWASLQIACGGLATQGASLAGSDTPLNSVSPVIVKPQEL